MKLVIATHNPAKFNRYKQLLSSFSQLEILSLGDLGIHDKITEPYETAAENALHKANGYAQLTKLPTLAIDEAALTNFLPENEQPGVYVRRVADRATELTDRETLAFWKETLRRFEQDDKAVIWDFRIAYVNLEHDEVKTSNIIMRAKVVDTFSKTIVPGYPMSSFLILEGSEKRSADLTEEERQELDKTIFKSFTVDFASWIT